MPSKKPSPTLGVIESSPSLELFGREREKYVPLRLFMEFQREMSDKFDKCLDEHDAFKEYINTLYRDTHASNKQIDNKIKGLNMDFQALEFAVHDIEHQLNGTPTAQEAYDAEPERYYPPESERRSTKYSNSEPERHYSPEPERRSTKYSNSEPGRHYSPESERRYYSSSDSDSDRGRDYQSSY
jgi:hypothetical protein